MQIVGGYVFYPSTNGSVSSEWRRLQGSRVENPSSARKGGEPTSVVGEVGRPGLTGLGPHLPSSVTASLPWVLMHLCTLPPPLA
jgi:hypothetical protein